MATQPTSRTPQGYFSVWQRLLRGYGPLVVFAILIALIAVLVPSKAPKSTLAAAGGDVAPGSSGAGVSSGSGVPASGSGSSTPGAGTAAGGAGGSNSGGGSASGGNKASSAPGVVTQCGTRSLQVPNDPYSPPCINFSGNNGGTTYKGVTSNEIHIAYRVTQDKGFQQTLAELAGANLQDTPADIERTISALAQYFNTHYQLYGRKIVIDYYNGQGQLTNELLGNGQAQADADALTVGQQMKSFGDLSAQSEPYADALARQAVMGFGDPYMSQAWHQQHAPYIWSIAVDGTKVASFAAEYEGKKLCPAGSPAKYAGGNLKDKPRKFASLAPENSWYQEAVQVARKVVQSYHCDPGENIEYQLDLSTMSNQAANIISKLQSDGVTTILCGCDPIIPVFLSGVAARQGYFPEFVITGTALTDQDVVGQLWTQSFAAHAFGISPNNAPVPSTQTLGYAAYKTVRQDEPAFGVEIIYYQMAMLALGIQMAGPNLTPQTFQAGMRAFPPKVGPAGLWSFGQGNYTIGEDVREICWSTSQISGYNQKQGAYFGTSSQRWTQGNIPGGPVGCPVPTS